MTTPLTNIARPAAALALALALTGCGDLLGYSIRHGHHADDDATQPPGLPLSKPDASLAPTYLDAAVPDVEILPSTPPPCRPSLGSLATFCTGASPRAIVDSDEMPLTDVRATGLLPAFHFILVDAPKQLVVRSGSGSAGPGKYDLTSVGETWDTQVYPASCPDGQCPPPKDWLGITGGDHLSGWIEIRGTSSDKTVASICLTVTRGASHAAEGGLPCRVVLYTPPVPVE